MAPISKLIDERVVSRAKEELQRIGKNALLVRKLHAVIAASNHGILMTAKVYDISRTTLTAWIKHLKMGNPDKLLAPPERRRKSILMPEHREFIKQLIYKQPTITIKDIQIRLLQKTGVKISKSTCHREIIKMKFSYITPRPQHYKKDPAKAAEFKKKYKK